MASACAAEHLIICNGLLWATSTISVQHYKCLLRFTLKLHTLNFKAEKVVPAAGEDRLVQALLREFPSFLHFIHVA